MSAARELRKRALHAVGTWATERRTPTAYAVWGVARFVIRPVVTVRRWIGRGPHRLSVVYPQRARFGVRRWRVERAVALYVGRVGLMLSPGRGY